jgi:D-sedoheptulose 7-phosphate isomerase
MNTFIQDLFARYPILEACRKGVSGALELLIKCYAADGTVLVCGNGGSAADADHLVGELMKGCLRRRSLPEDLRFRLRETAGDDGAFLGDVLQGTLRAIALTAHSALVSAYTNDQSGEAVFAQQVLGYGRAGDVFIGISTSGNSRNVILAAQMARVRGLSIVGLTGKSGGRLGPLCDALIAAPEEETFKVQELHLPVYHALAAALEAEMFEA